MELAPEGAPVCLERLIADEGRSGLLKMGKNQSETVVGRRMIERNDG